jgi:hypothetical protein
MQGEFRRSALAIRFYREHNATKSRTKGKAKAKILRMAQ